MKGLYSWQFLSEMFPPAATFTAKDISDLTGKTYLITGGAAGIGFECAKILYSKNATVYIAGRSASNAAKAISTIQDTNGTSQGRLEFLHLDLGDLTTVKPAAEEFLKKESRLDVLWNNAGIMIPPVGSQTKQGYEIQLGTNCIGHFALTHLLSPLIRKTASASPPGSVRVVWLASSAAHTSLPGGVDLEDPNNRNGKQTQHNLYSQSKTGDIFLGSEMARRLGTENVLSVSINPGLLRTDILRHAGSLMQNFLHYAILHEPINGAYTMLFAGLSPEVTLARNGQYIMPFGRFGEIRDDLAAALLEESDGGTGGARKFWDYCEAETKAYL